MSFSAWLNAFFYPRHRTIRNRRQAVRVHNCHPGVEVLEDRITPALYIVDGLTDTGIGSGNTGDLLYCLTQANANGTTSDNTILFGVSGLINLTATLPDIANDLTITVPGNGGVTINGNSLGSVLLIDSGETVSLSGLTITGGSGNNLVISGNNNLCGGGIFNEGTLTVSNCNVSGNSAARGGGIYNDGIITISNCTLANNNGGGIYSDGNGTLVVNNCDFSNNTAPNVNVDGGGIYNLGTLAVDNSTFTGNSAGFFGGGISSWGGTATIGNCTFSGNTTEDGGGGAIMDYNCTMTVSNCTLFDNTADTLFTPIDWGGGGIYNDGPLTVTDCTLYDNSAYEGGGIDNEYSGALTVSNCSLYGNSGYYLGGGIYNNSMAAILNSTIYGNSATGTYQFGGETFYPGGEGGGIDQDSSQGGSTTLQDTIVAGNSASNGATDPDFAGAVSSSTQINGVTYAEGYNLIGDGTGSSGFSSASGDQVGTSSSPINPELGPLQNNGGPTETMALLYGSPAINSGDPYDAGSLPQFDQRGPGYPRIQGGRVDIGAYESPYPPSPEQLAFANFPSTVVAGQDFNFQVDIEDLFGNLVTSDYSTVIASLTGPGPFTSGSTSVQASGGIASFIGMSIQTAGSYSLQVSDPGDGLTPISIDFTVIPSSPATLTVVSGSGQSTTVGTAFGTVLQAKLSDAYGNPINGASVTFTVVPGNNGATGTFNGNPTVFTNNYGIATAPVLIAGDIPGNFTVTASIGNLSAEFSLTNTVGAPASITAVGPGHRLLQQSHRRRECHLRGTAQWSLGHL
jgi:hypothetical protein